MALNANLFVVLSLSSLLIFAQAHQSPSPAPAPAAKSNVNLAQAPRSPAKAPAPAPAAKPKIAVSSISSSPRAAPAPSPISLFEGFDLSEFDDMKDVGKSIDVIVEETLTKIQKRFGQVIDHVINQGLAEDSLADAGEKQCLYVCKDDFAELYSGFREIREEFNRTHDFSLAIDALMSVVEEVRPCQKCMHVYHGGENPFDQLSDWLLITTHASAFRLQKLLHH